MRRLAWPGALVLLCAWSQAASERIGGQRWAEETRVDTAQFRADDAAVKHIGDSTRGVNSPFVARSPPSGLVDDESWRTHSSEQAAAPNAVRSDFAHAAAGRNFAADTTTDVPTSPGPGRERGAGDAPSAIPAPSVAPMTIAVPIIYRLVAASASLSAVGSLFIIVTWFLFKELQFLGRKLIMFIAVADLVTSANFILSMNGIGAATHPSMACTIQAFFLEFASLASCLWTACFAFHLYQLICKDNPRPHKFEPFYHVLCWGVPLAFDGVLLFRYLSGRTSVGDADRPWCWINNPMTRGGAVWNTGTLEQFGFFYLPLSLVFAWNLSLYAVLGARVRGLAMGRTIQTRLLLYLLVFLLCSVWGLSNRVYQVVTPHHRANTVLSYLEATLGPLQGFLNAVVYGVNKQVMHHYVACFRRCCCCCCRRRRRHSSSDAGAGAVAGAGADSEDEDAGCCGCACGAADGSGARDTGADDYTDVAPSEGLSSSLSTRRAANTALPADAGFVDRDGMGASDAPYAAFRHGAGVRPAGVPLPPPQASASRGGWPVAAGARVPVPVPLPVPGRGRGLGGREGGPAAGAPHRGPLPGGDAPQSSPDQSSVGSRASTPPVRYAPGIPAHTGDYEV